MPLFYRRRLATLIAPAQSNPSIRAANGFA
jgi:hypothetical protein